jgi:lysophospholipase L1-like esterase
MKNSALDRIPVFVSSPSFAEIKKEKEDYKPREISAILDNAFGDCVDYSGRYLNVRQGVRRTTDAPSQDNGKVVCLGGSTTFCADVPDHETWASVLQREFRERGIPLRVENRGRMGATARNRLQYLRQHILLDEVRAVILYFGVNDSGWKALRDRIGMPKISNLAFRSGLATASFLSSIVEPQFITDLAKDVAQSTIEEIHSASASLAPSGIPLLAVLQPHYWIDKPLPGRMDRHHPSLFNIDRRFLVALSASYQVYRQNLWNQEIAFSDYSHLMTRNSEQFFVDWAHNSPSGCEILGKSLCDTLMSHGFVDSVQKNF